MKKYILSTICLLVFSATTVFGQERNKLEELLADKEKGSYAILEVRLNKEDEFRTIEGTSSSVTRISLFTGENREKEILVRKFNGFNDVVSFLNRCREIGWFVKDTYRMNGESLLIVHYLLVKKKR